MNPLLERENTTTTLLSSRLDLYTVIERACSSILFDRKLAHMIYKRLSFLGMIIFSIFSITAAQNAADPFANMTDEEFAQMLNYIDNVAKQFEEEYKKLTPEQQAQVDRELREELIRNGIDPDTLQPLNQPAQQVPQQPPATPTPPIPPSTPLPISDQPTCASTQKYTPQQASCLLQKIISLIESCRRKLSLMPLKDLPLNHWLSVLALYTKTISTNEHIQRLTLITYERLFQLLTKLESILSIYEPQLTVTPQDDTDQHDASLDPYRILGVSPRASDDDITANYQALCAAYDMKKIEQNLKEQKLNPQRIKRQLDAIKLQLRNIEDAYEQLHDAKLRAQIDRNTILIYQQRYALEKESQLTYLEFQNALHQLILNGLFEAFDQFFAQFEPIAIAHRKEMDTAEQQRRTEQEARHRLVATPSNNIRGGEYPDWYPTPEPQNYYAPTPLPSYTPSTSMGSGQGGPSGSGSSETNKKDDGSSKQRSGGGGGAQQKPSEQTKKDKDDAQKKNATKKDAQQKTPQQLFTDLNKGITELDKIMQEVTPVLEEKENKKIIADTSSTTFDKLDDQNKHNLATLLQKIVGKNDKLTTTFNNIRTAAEELTKNPNQQAAVSKIWIQHKNHYTETYDTLTNLHRPLKRFVDNHPETTLAPVFTKFVEGMKAVEQLDKIAKIQPPAEQKKNAANKQQRKKNTNPPQRDGDREDKEDKSKQQEEEAQHRVQQEEE